MPENENSMVDLKKYLGTPGQEVSMDEFKQFWDSCTDAEKLEFKQTKLDK